MSTGTGRRLDSWKEISDYLGRDVRTAIRWEHERRLPVHRIPGGGRAAVFAFTGEIDAWRAGMPANGAARAPINAEPALVEPPPGSGPTAAQARRARLRPWQALAAGLGGLALLLTASVWLVLARQRGGAPTARQVPATVSVEGRTLTAWTEGGTPLWRYELEHPLPPDQQVDRQTSSWMHTVADIDGDGRVEVVASVELLVSPGLRRNDLLCLSDKGAVRWRTVVEDEIRFRSRAFGPPWCAFAPHFGSSVVHYKVGEDIRIAWALGHHRWWPSMLIVLDRQGHRLANFVHAGAIYFVLPVEGSSGPLLLLGGISNSRQAAFLAVVDGADPSGHGPEEPGSPFECLECGSRAPLRYFVFPPSELLRAEGTMPYNRVAWITPVASGYDVNVRETPLESLEGVFSFSRDFELLHAQWSDGWSAYHRRFEREGKLDHTLERCPYHNKPAPVREWTLERGWRDVRPSR